MNLCLLELLLSVLFFCAQELFILGNDNRAEVNSIFYTCLASCEQAGIEAILWLTLKKIPVLQNPIDWDVLL